MFERFTDRARRAVVLAQEEVRLRGDREVGTEHLLAGLVLEGDGVAGSVLSELGVTIDRLRAGLDLPKGGSPGGHIPFTDECKAMMERSLTEALRLGHNHIGTEHLLLGLCRTEIDEHPNTVIGGVRAYDIRTAVLTRLRGYDGVTPVHEVWLPDEHRHRFASGQRGFIFALSESLVREIAAAAPVEPVFRQLYDAARQVVADLSCQEARDAFVREAQRLLDINGSEDELRALYDTHLADRVAGE